MPGAFSPIPEVQLGAEALIFGITTNGTPISITGLAEFELDSDDLTLTWDEKEFKDTTGNDTNITQKNFRYERSIKLLPSGSSRTNAVAVAEYSIADNGGVYVPLQMTSIYVANYKIAAFNGEWIVRPGTKVSLKMDDWCSIDVSCKRYANAGQNADLNTVITG